METRNFLEGSAIAEGEDEQETFSRPHVLLAHGRELILSSGVQDVQPGHGVVHHQLLGVGVLYRWVVVRRKETLKNIGLKFVQICNICNKNTIFKKFLRVCNTC